VRLDSGSIPSFGGSAVTRAAGIANGELGIAIELGPDVARTSIGVTRGGAVLPVDEASRDEAEGAVVDAFTTDRSVAACGSMVEDVDARVRNSVRSPAAAFWPFVSASLTTVVDARNESNEPRVDVEAVVSVALSKCSDARLDGAAELELESLRSNLRATASEPVSDDGSA